MRKPILAGNWKMNKTTNEAVKFAGELKEKVGSVTEREVVICPAFTALGEVAKAIRGSNIELGAQDMYWEDAGAFTGQVSSVMLKDSGCGYVILGHSERRQYFGETNQTVNRKVRKALSAGGLTPIVCVGERLEEREQNLTFKIIEAQVKEGLNEINPDNILRLVIAYEPVWAIGTGKTASPQQAEEVHSFIRGILSKLAGDSVSQQVRILYGGSVTPENVSGLMACNNIDGGLVGGASLKLDSFVSLVNYK